MFGVLGYLNTITDSGKELGNYVSGIQASVAQKEVPFENTPLITPDVSKHFEEDPSGFCLITKAGLNDFKKSEAEDIKRSETHNLFRGQIEENFRRAEEEHEKILRYGFDSHDEDYPINPDNYPGYQFDPVVIDGHF